jgi:phosphoglycolate phosphatase
MNLAKPQAVIFDWDNTLVDSWKKMYLVINETFKEMGLPLWDMETIKKNIKYSFADAGVKLFGERVHEAKKLYYFHYTQTFADVNCEPLPETVNLLDTLKKNNIYTAIVSNKTGDLLRKEVKTLNWEGYFQAVVGSKDAEFDKPKPHPVYFALQNKFTPLKDKVWFVGDSSVDVECAINSGCVPLLYGDKEAAQDLEDKAINYYHIPSHKELIELL